MLKFISQILCVFLFFVVLTSPLCSFANEPILSDQSFLEEIQQDTIQYFTRYSDRKTGFVYDSSSPGSPSSVAATGFALASYAIAQDHGWMEREVAYKIILKTLSAMSRKAEHERGFFYHFINPHTGDRTWGSEASSIDTALFLAGALLAGQYFQGTPIETMAHRLYDRVDWDWMRNRSDLICMGWTPEEGFLPYYWDQYSEHLILQALAIGSSTHPVGPGYWRRWNRFEDEFEGKTIVYSHTGSLFTYQYSHAFIDFRNLYDQGVNYFENSVKASLSNYEFCQLNQDEYETYRKGWGLTASLGPGGYKAYGAKPGLALHDGTIAPYGAAGALVFAPKKALEALRYFYEEHGDDLYGRYGFKDSFNLNKQWFSRDYLAIDQGITVLMIENYLNQKVWKHFMKLTPIQRWIQLCHLDQEPTEPPREVVLEPVVSNELESLSEEEVVLQMLETEVATLATDASDQ